MNTFRLSRASIVAVISAVALLLFALVVPNAYAEADSNISSVSASSSSSAVGGTADYTVDLTTAATLDVGDVLSFFMSADGSPLDLGYSFGEATFDSGSISGSFASSVSDVFGVVTLDTELPAGTYSFTLSDVTNPTTAGSVYFRMSTDTEFGQGIASTSDETAIQIGDTVDVTAIEWTPESVFVGATDVDHTIVFTVDGAVSAGSTLSVIVFDEEGPTDLIDFSEVSIVSDTVEADSIMVGEETSVMDITLTSELAQGDHTMVLSLDNPTTATADTLQMGMDTVNSGSGTYSLLTDAVDFTALYKPADLRLKKKKQQSATLRWDEVAGAEKYIVQLKTKKKKKIKTWKSVTTTKRTVLKKKKFLKAGRVYKFRVRAASADGEVKSKWSAYKKFTMKGTKA